LIAPSGELYMISSRLAEPEITTTVAPNMTIERIVSRSVPFDVEAIRREGADAYIQWLRGERGLETRNQLLVHNIAIYRVTHRTPAHNESQP
jgi:hypothetical protein